MKKQIGKPLMQKLKNKIGVRLSALDKKKLVLTNLPYALAAFYADRAFFLYRNSPGEDMGNKLLYAMEHADRIFAGFVLSNNWKDLLAGITVAIVLKVLVWQKQADAKKLRKGIEYGSARWGTAEDIKPYMSEDPWMNIPLTATEALTMESRPKQPKYARNKNIVVIGGSGSGKTRFFCKAIDHADELFHGHYRSEGLQCIRTEKNRTNKEMFLLITAQGKEVSYGTEKGQICGTV